MYIDNFDIHDDVEGDVDESSEQECEEREGQKEHPPTFGSSLQLGSRHASSTILK